MLQVLVPFIAFATVVACVYTLWRPHWAFLLVVLMFPLEQLLQAYIPLFVQRQSLANIAVIAIALVAVTMRSFRREQITVGYGNPVTIFILLLYVMWAVGLLYSPVQDALQRNWSTYFAYQFLLLVLLPLLIVDVYQFRRMILGLMIAGSLMAALVILNPRSTYYSGRLVMDIGMIGVGARDAGNPLAIASMGAIVALTAALYRPERATLMVNLLRVAAFIMGLGVAIGSGSRGQVLAATLTGIVFYPISRKLANPKQFLLTAFGFLVLIGGIYIVFKMFIGHQNQERWDPLLMLRDTTLRLDMVWVLFAAYLESPGSWIFGLGTLAYEAVGHGPNPDYVHNLMAEVLCEHGIVGAAFLVLSMIFLFRYGRGLWSMYRDDPSMRATVSILMAICVSSLLEALKQGSMSTGGPFPWWLVLAKLYCFERKVYAASSEFEPSEQAREEYAEFGESPQPLPEEPEAGGTNPKGYALG